jgi:uncharacterized protein YjbJ (UPF0337 family)
MVDKNRVEGAVEKVVGTAEETVGRIAGDQPSRTEGLARQATGSVQSAYGEARDNARGIAAQLGEITKEQPYWMLLSAGVIGFVLGRFSVSTRRHGRS